MRRGPRSRRRRGGGSRRPRSRCTRRSGRRAPPWPRSRGGRASRGGPSTTEERELFAACQGHWLELHPPPQLDPTEGAEPLLRALYGWYRESARMAENVQRDRASLPELDALLRETADTQMSALGDALGGGPLAALALDFWTWRRLAAEGLDDAEAAALMADIISP